MKIKLDKVRGDDWYNLERPICGKRFHLNPCAVKRNKNHYCSKEYHHIAKPEYMKGEKNHQYGLRGEKNASWLGETIKIKRVTETAILPERKSIGAAGYDLCVDSSEPIIIPPHSSVMVSSGIAFEIPKNYFGAIYARSGLSLKEGIRPSTCVSVIDSDYRGNVGLPLHNDTSVERIVEPYSRVAQIVFQPALIVELELVDELEETDRGSAGFGSTGK